MKKIIGPTLLTLVLAVVVAVLPGVSSAGGGGDVNGPACVDINGAQTSFTGTAPTYTFAARLLLGADQAAAACKNITYTTYIVTDPGVDPIVLVNQGSTDFGPIMFADADGSICIYSTTERNGRLLDRAPDMDCLTLLANASGGASGYN